MKNVCFDGLKTPECHLRRALFISSCEPYEKVLQISLPKYQYSARLYELRPLYIALKGTERYRATIGATRPRVMASVDCVSAD